MYSLKLTIVRVPQSVGINVKLAVTLHILHSFFCLFNVYLILKADLYSQFSFGTVSLSPSAKGMPLHHVLSSNIHGLNSM